MSVPVNSIAIDISVGSTTTAPANITGYLGIGGREFRLNRSGVQDFVSNTTINYVLGSGANIENSGDNNPSKITDGDCDNPGIPVYFRVEFTNTGSIEINSLSVVANFTGGTPQTYTSTLLPLKLGEASGKTIYLKKQ
jgi:hypothetical protein